MLLTLICQAKGLKADMSDDVTDALKDQIERNESSIKAQNESLAELEKSLSKTSDSANKMSGKMEYLEEEVTKVLNTLGEMQVS